MNTVAYDGILEPGAFAGVTLVGVDFSNLCLVGADFSGAVCKDCDFSGSDLSMADFTGADLYRCTFARTVLYGAKLGDANLTRTDFEGAFIYGWLLHDSANVTYANLLSFELESRRRSVAFSGLPSEQTMRFGQIIPDTTQLCHDDYQVGRVRFTFADLDLQEAALQRAQIFNRLKQLYRENHDGRTALHCHFHERYFLTRSRFKHSALTEGRHRDGVARTFTHTGFSYAAEVISGYGVRPLRILRVLAALFAVFLVTACLVTSLSDGSGVIRQGVGVTAGPTSQAAGRPEVVQVTEDLGRHGADIGRLVQFSALSLVNPELNQFTPYGVMIPITLVYFALSACLLALLFSSVFVRLLSE
ncbi:pentapeptide repeat-containing protein [Streptomyces sp. RKAG337]|uniref:pentapeptide repeat-containing protein n=1 Tax=Streptomyces sp. RKAG337 TaxID=2893404 RepID=UPI0020346A44|nr:pentapeptide repeat-containing protein [Streptomyces sp. RKAG337]MCM2427890.1 pentapeptide repeat-containing protein [Streptomyces sp. RKAG337]